MKNILKLKNLLIIGITILIFSCSDIEHPMGYLMNLSLKELKNENDKIKELRNQNPSDEILFSKLMISSFLINQNPNWENTKHISNFEQLEERWKQLHNGSPERKPYDLKNGYATLQLSKSIYSSGFPRAHIRSDGTGFFYYSNNKTQNCKINLTWTKRGNNAEINIGTNPNCPGVASKFNGSYPIE